MKSVRPFGVSFYIRKNKNIKKDYSVFCCIRVGESSPKELCVASDVKRDDWDLRKGRPKQRSDHLIKLSLFLESIKAKLFEIYLDIKLNNDELSAENINNIYL